MTDTLKNQAANLDVANLASEGNVQAVLGGIDTQALAAKAGVSAQQGAAGLKAIVPTLLGLLSSKAGGAEGLLGMLRGLGDDSGGMLGKLGKMGKGLFGN